jgi:hypothetical protein
MPNITQAQAKKQAEKLAAWAKVGEANRNIIGAQNRIKNGRADLAEFRRLRQEAIAVAEAL